MEKAIQEIQLPQAFAERMKALMGAEYDAFIGSYQKERVQGLRFNTLKGDPKQMYEAYRERFGLVPVPWCSEGYYYQAETRPGRCGLHEAGVYYIQEPSAMAVVQLLDPKPGERVLDLCAAPGGKTSHVACRLQGQGLLVSNEIHPARARVLSQNVERMGIANAVVTNEDAGRLAEVFQEFFDKIVVDAPCSGEGMFRKDEQAREEWSEENVRICAERQQIILDHAASMLRPGGRLVYSTCTFSPEEDEEGIADFLMRHPEFSVVSVPKEQQPPGLSAGRQEWCSRPCPSVSDTFRIWPHLAEGEGHFLALLEKHADGEAVNRSRKIRRPGFWNDKSGKRLLNEFLQEVLREQSPAAGKRKGSRTEALPLEPLIGRTEQLILFGDQIYQLPEGIPALDGLRVLRPGLHLGTCKKNRIEPAHALALALRPDQVRQALILPEEGPETLAYLNGQTLPVPEGQKGWTLVCAGNYSLGWGKCAGGVVKNHYPKGLRIQK